MESSPKKIVAWRFVRSNSSNDPFSGEGSALYPGRWNLRGHRMLYTAGSHSLGILEILVNLNAVETPQDYLAYKVEFDATDCLSLPSTVLPKNWKDYPPPEKLKELGIDWLKSQKSIALRVPSAVVETEFNYLLNPQHPLFSKRVTLAPKNKALKFSIDPRLL